MGDLGKFLLAAVVVVLAVTTNCQVHRQAVTCPISTAEASAAANACLSKTRVSLAPSTGMSTYAELEQGCNSGSFVETIECLKDLLRSCDEENPAISKSLRLKHDVELLSDAISRVCGNLATIANSHCSRRKFLKHKVCMRTTVTDVQARILHHSRVKSEGTADKFTELACEYYYAVLSSCMEKALRSANCSDAVTSLFLLLPRSTIPPFCNMATTTAPPTMVETKKAGQEEPSKIGLPKSQVQTVKSGNDRPFSGIITTIGLLTIFRVLFHLLGF